MTDYAEKGLECIETIKDLIKTALKCQWNYFNNVKTDTMHFMMSTILNKCYNEYVHMDENNPKIACERIESFLKDAKVYYEELMKDPAAHPKEEGYPYSFSYPTR